MSLFEFDNQEKQGFDFVIGTDEAGRGPAAGGVFASAVCFKEGFDKTLFKKLNDSKKISEKTREELFEPIKENAFCCVKGITVEKIESINILNASLLAMKYAVEDVIKQIKSNNAIVLVDGNKIIKETDFNQKFVIKGDSKSASIAAASILAKVTRDRYMLKIHEEFPQYCWDKNKGYLTKAHIEAIQNLGICKYHRKSFLKNIIA